MAANSYKRAVEELDTKTARELDAPYRATVLEPVGKLCSYFPEINKTIEKRNKKVSWKWGDGDGEKVRSVIGLGGKMDL